MDALLRQGVSSIFGPLGDVNECQKQTGVKGKLSEAVLAKVTEGLQEVRDDKKSAARGALELHREELLDSTLLLPGFDPSQDTPIELLHTFLLGVIKYLWHSTFTSLSKGDLNRFVANLSNASHSSIVGPPTSQTAYIGQYPNSLIGRHFRKIVQLGAFVLDGLRIKDDLFTAWLDLGRLTSLVWFTQIKQMDRYLRNLRLATANFLDGFSRLFPDKILRKVKLHLLVHLEEDVLAFGPLVGVSSERFESFNAVFRNAAVCSNRKLRFKAIYIILK